MAEERFITARVISEKEGIRSFDNVRAIRIRSPKSNLLIMLDYTPILGKVEGDVTIVTEDEEVKMEGISGYYKHLRNEFTLLVKESGYDIQY